MNEVALSVPQLVVAGYGFIVALLLAVAGVLIKAAWSAIWREIHALRGHVSHLEGWAVQKGKAPYEAA
jgi:hypothetical protein